MKTYLDYKLESENGLFKTSFEDGYVVWKPLTWGRYKKYREAHALNGQAISLQLEETLFKECLIHSSYDETPPPDLNQDEIVEWVEACRADMPAGVISTVTKLILNLSGATSGPAIIDQLDKHRSLIHNIEDQLVVAICQAFPAYRPEDIEALDWQTVLKRAAQAEIILDTFFELQKDEPLERPKMFNVTEDMKTFDGSQERKDQISDAEAYAKAQREKKREYLARREAVLRR